MEMKHLTMLLVISFNEQQSGYVAGLVAGKMTKTNKVGFVGGMDNVVIKNSRDWI